MFGIVENDHMIIVILPGIENFPVNRGIKGAPLLRGKICSRMVIPFKHTGRGRIFG